MPHFIQHTDLVVGKPRDCITMITTTTNVFDVDVFAAVSVPRYCSHNSVVATNHHHITRSQLVRSFYACTASIHSYSRVVREMTETTRVTVDLVSTDRQTLIEGALTTLIAFGLSALIVRTETLGPKRALMPTLADGAILPLSLLVPFLQQHWNEYGYWVTDAPFQSSLMLAGIGVASGMVLGGKDVVGPPYFTFANIAFSHSLARLIGKRVFATEHTIKSRWWI